MSRDILLQTTMNLVSGSSGIIGVNPSTVTEASNCEGVLIGRHKTLPGSVLNFDMFGTTINLLTLDAAHRTKLQFGTYGTDVPSLANFQNQSKSNGWYLPSDLRGQTDNPPTVSIAKLQDEWSEFSTDKTARENCDIWMSYNNSTDSQSIKGVPAVAHCRSLTNIISGGCDLPNEFELMVIFLCMNQIDALDPTITSNPNYALGNVKGVSSKRWNFDGAGYAWSSTEYSSNHVRYVGYDGYCYYLSKSRTRGVVPVRELAA